MFECMEGIVGFGGLEPGEVLAAAAEVLRSAAAEPARVHNAALGGLMEGMGHLASAVQAARVAVTGEAITRGVLAESTAASPTDWVLQRSPDLAPADARRVGDVARTAGHAELGPVADAVRTGRVGLSNAGVVLTEFGKLSPRLVPQAAPAVLEGFLTIAAGHTPREIRALRRRIIAEHGRPGELDRVDTRLSGQRGLSAGLDDDGVTEYRLRLDPEAAATLEAALTPLAAPRPSTQEGPDLRCSDQRRADALIEILQRGVRAARGVPVTTKTAIVVTIDLHQLQQHTDTQTGYGHTGALTGGGYTTTGEVLPAGTVRRLACDADIIPTVLGTDSEVLDVGRRFRLATPGQIRALRTRDTGCTFPGCTHLVRGPPRPPLGRRRPHRPRQPRPPLRATPHHRPPTRPHRHRHQHRRHLARSARPRTGPPTRHQDWPLAS